MDEAGQDRKDRRQGYAPALFRATQELAGRDPLVLAHKSGAQVCCCDGGADITFSLWGKPVAVRWPSGTVEVADGSPLTVAWRLLALHYLLTADGTPLADRWLSFRELPDGRVYDSAFRRRSSQLLVAAYGSRLESLGPAATKLGGVRICFGDAAYMFQVLPRARVAVIMHAGDDEFAPEANMLFDASMRHYLPIEDVAVLGGLVAVELVRAGKDPAR